MTKKTKEIKKRVRVKHKDATVTFRVSTDNKQKLEKYADTHTNGNLSKAFDRIVNFLL